VFIRKELRSFSYFGESLQNRTNFREVVCSEIAFLWLQGATKWGAAVGRSYAAVDWVRTAFAAVRITSITRSGWESIGTWLLSSS